MHDRGTADFLDIHFDLATMTEVAEWLGNRTAKDAFSYLVTPNVDHVVQIERNPLELKPLYEQAGLCLCDSRVLARLGRFAGIQLTVVPGSDLVVMLFEAIMREGDTVCVVGADIDSIARLRALYPHLTVIHDQPAMGLRHDHKARASAVAIAIAARARFTLLAVGCPQQELLAFEMAQMPESTGTALCIGAAIDFIVGNQARAPRAFQRAGLEWLWRLAVNPRRLGRRYLWDGPRIFLIALRWRQRTKKRAAVS